MFGIQQNGVRAAESAEYDDTMCGRYTLIRGDKIKIVFNVTIPANLRLVAPGTMPHLGKRFR